MPLTPAKCTACGAALEVNAEADAALCKFCGTPFIVEKAINLYQTANHITAGTVNIVARPDFEIRGGVLVKYHGSATEVVVPDGVVEIGSGAFGGCAGITSIRLPDGVETIRNNAFSGCTRLANIVLPGSLVEIGKNAFSGCSSLSRIRFPRRLRFVDGTDLDEVELCSIVSQLQVFHGCDHSLKLTGYFRRADFPLGDGCLNVKKAADFTAEEAIRWKRIGEKVCPVCGVKPGWFLPIHYCLNCDTKWSVRASVE